MAFFTEKAHWRRLGLALLLSLALLSWGAIIQAAFWTDALPLAGDNRGAQQSITPPPSETFIRRELGANGTPIEVRRALYQGVVRTNLWASAQAAGLSAAVFDRLTAIYAWQLDLERQVYEGDRWRLSVEHIYESGRPPRFGAILAAELENHGVPHVAIRHQSAGGNAAYFHPDGTSLKQTYRRSPLLHAGRITSGFQARRFHPILKSVLPHLGIDYAAPLGEPILAVGDGVVSTAANLPGSGRTIKIQHGNGDITVYKHLFTFATGIHPGTPVQMGQMIGRVGMSGLATGPHLHFEFLRGGAVIDPLSLRLGGETQIAANEAAAFNTKVSRELAAMPPWAPRMQDIQANAPTNVLSSFAKR